MDRDINKLKEEYISIYKNNITRDGSLELLDFLIKTDFFSAPASTTFHSAYEGGLCEHTINVYNRFRNMVISEFGENFSNKISEESIAICALLHDVCKVDCYKIEMRNKKVDGNWVQVPTYVMEDSLPYGHGEKSVYIISGFMKLTREEAMIINWHMGGFDARVKGGYFGLSDAFYKFPLAVMFHTSDMLATYLDETK